MRVELDRPRKDVTFGNPGSSSSCLCEICRGRVPFQAPSELIEAFVDGRIVLFAGAGISTESRKVIPDTLYDQISFVIHNKDKNRPFPDVMQEFCNGPASRVALIERIQDRIDYIYSHRELYDEATRFHRQLSTFYPIDTIITTNWEPYFEDECAATGFVEDRDIPLWDAAKRKVLKVHGTIRNFGSIVATRTDYERCARKLRSGVMGAHLKSLLATRSTVFIGYSLRDDDFLQIYDATRRHLADFHRQAYFVAPDVSDSDRARLAKMKLHVIETDGEFFIAQLKKHAQSCRFISSDDMYDDVSNLLSEVQSAHIWLHDSFSCLSHPQILITSWYQDGLIHSLERILRQRKTGEYSDLARLGRTVASYQAFASLYRLDKKFGDAAYCLGYANGLRFASLPAGNRTEPPLFFHFGGLTTSGRSIYRRHVNKLPGLHKRVHRYVKGCVSKFPPHDDIVLHHRAELDLGRFFDDDE